MIPPTGPDRFFDLLPGVSLLLATAGGPLVATLVARGYALEPGRRPADAWFGFRVLTSWLQVLMWLAWPLVITDAPVMRMLATILSPFGRVAVSGAVLAASILPILISTVVMLWITRGVTHQLRSEGWTHGESRRQVNHQIAAMVIAMVGFGIAGTLAMNWLYRPALLIGVVSLVGMIACLTRYRRLAGYELQAITFGELRTRLFDMGARVGVPLKQLHVMPMARGRMANAFALNDQSVILTDYLIQKLSRREIEAVMAHEIAHLRLRHPMKLAFAMVLILAPSVAALLFLQSWKYVGLAVLASVLVRLVIARRFEFQADREAVRICGDAEALISGLSALGAANVMPLHWNRSVELLMTHPSTLRRIERIAAENGVPAERLAALLRREGLDDGYYEQPRILTGKAFSSPWKRKILQRLTLIRLGVAAGVPALLFSIGGFLTPPPVLFWASVALAFVTMLLFHERTAVAVIAALERKVRALRPDGDLVPARAFVALAPGDDPRVYEGFLDWDLGLLTIGADRIEYAGEETRFVLTPSEVTSITLMPGSPAWIRVPWVRIEWRDAAGVPGSFRLRLADATRMSQTQGAAKALFASLERWRTAHAPGVAADGALDAEASLPPRPETVTGESLARVVSPRAFVPLVPWVLVMTAITCVMFGLPFDPFHGPGWLQNAGAALLALIVFQLPYWLFVRAPRPQRREAKAA